MAYKIRDWEKHFEQDRSKQWKHLKWVPIPNKQGAGYRKIMDQKNGLELFACWIALVQVGSICEPRGDLSKYDLNDLSRLTIISVKKIEVALKFLSQQLDWIEVIPNLDISVKNLDIHGKSSAVGSSIQFNSILLDSLNQSDIGKPKVFKAPSFEEFETYCKEKGFWNIAKKVFEYYSTANWHDAKGDAVKNWKQKLISVWFKDENKDKTEIEFSGFKMAGS